MVDNIKVAIKVRPLIKREEEDNLPVQWIVQKNCITPIDPELKKRADGRYHFDHIFDMGTNNRDIFDTIVRPIVDAAVNGFNGTVFAYGQTGSGKTYTMMGIQNEPGIIPFAIEYLFDAIANTVRREFLLRVSYIEIYNEKINDLLNKSGTDLKMHEESSGQLVVNCKEEITNSPEYVLSIMKKGDKNRRTGETNMNERSSRSHTIFRITIESRETDSDSDGAIKVSQLNLVDLAGSERVNQTGATGERFKEGLHINLSLSALGLVIRQLSEAQEFVNFRNSKLTRLLQTSLGGNAKTVIICAITPAALEESQSTLLFASQAKIIKNKPQLNEVMSDAALLKRYAKQINKLNAELERIKKNYRSAEEMESKLYEKDQINQLLEERIELLKTHIVSGGNKNNEESFKCKFRRRQTWCGPGGLPTIEEISPEKPSRRSIIQSVDLANQTFQIDFADFELELINDERERENDKTTDSDEDVCITKRTYKNHVKFLDDESNYDNVPKRKNVFSQTVSQHQLSPGTPKHLLRETINFLTKDLHELREYTTLEKQIYCNEDQCYSYEQKVQQIKQLEEQIKNLNTEKTAAIDTASKLEEQIKKSDFEKKMFENEIILLRKQVKEIGKKDEICNDTSALQKQIIKKSRSFENIITIDQIQANELQSQSILDLENQIAKITSENLESQHLVAKLETSLNEMKQQYEKRELEKNSEFQQQITHLTQDKIEFELIIVNLQDKLKELRKQYEILKETELEKQVAVNVPLSTINFEDFSSNSQTETKFARQNNSSEIEKHISDLRFEEVTFKTLLIELSKKVNKTEYPIIIELGEEVEKFIKNRVESQQVSNNSSTEMNSELLELEKERDLEKEVNLSNNSLNTAEDILNITSLKQENSKLVADLQLKIQESDEIKNDIQALKVDIENLQKTIFSLTTENMEMSNKLIIEKEQAQKAEFTFQKTIDELYEQNSKITGEKVNFQNEIAILNDQLMLERTKSPQANDDQGILEYEDKINKLTAENIELSYDLAKKVKEFEVLQESKSLLFEHECIYKDEINNLVEKNKVLVAENNELSSDLIEKIEENDALAKEYEVIKNKLEMSIKEKVESSEQDIQQLTTKNNQLKTEIVELQTKVGILTEENTTFSKQLLENLEDIDNIQSIENLRNDSLHLSSMFDISIYDAKINREDKYDVILSENTALQEKVNYLTRLNKKLTDLKLSSCTQCSHLKEVNESHRELKLQTKTLSHKLQNLQRKFERQCADTEAIKKKANNDINSSICDTSLDISLFDKMDNIQIEEQISLLSNKLQALKDDHFKLFNFCKEKCIEFKDIDDNNISETILATNDTPTIEMHSESDKSVSKKLHENIALIENDLYQLKNSMTGFTSTTTKFLNEKAILLTEIKELKDINNELEQKVSNSEVLLHTANEKSIILENEITELSKKFETFNQKQREIESQKLLLEVELESLKIEKDKNIGLVKESHEIIFGLFQNISIRARSQLTINQMEELIHCTALRECKEIDQLQHCKEYVKEIENKFDELKEALNKSEEENNKLKEAVLKLQNDMQDILMKLKEENNKDLLEKKLIDDNMKLTDELNTTRNSIIEEIKALKSKKDDQKLLNTSTNELFLTFMQIVMLKEKEIIDTMQRQFNNDKQKLEDEKRQSADIEKRATSWAKELEIEIEKLQNDLTKQEEKYNELQNQNSHIDNLLQEKNREKLILLEKIRILETDYNNLQVEFNKKSKIETMEEINQERRKKEISKQKAVKDKEAEFQLKMQHEKDEYEKRTENMISTIQSYKTKNMELMQTLEGFEAHEKHLQNIIDIKSAELIKNNQMMEEIKLENEKLMNAYNELHNNTEKKDSHILDIETTLKIKCDLISEYRTKLEMLLPSYNFLKEQVEEKKMTIEKYKTEIESLKNEKKRQITDITVRLSSAEITHAELNKQLTELNNKNIILVTELTELQNKYKELEYKNAKLEKKIRNSAIKAKIDADMEALKDQNKILQNNFEGASNRITELLENKNKLLEDLISYKKQNEMLLQETAEMKKLILSNEEKLNSTDSLKKQENYNILLQEKNRIAFELEEKKMLLSLKEKDIEGYISQIKDLIEKNKELDKEADDLAQENEKLTEKIYSYFDDDSLLNKLEIENKALKEENKNHHLELIKFCTLKKEHAELCEKLRDLQNKIESKNNNGSIKCISPNCETNKRRYNRNEIFNQKRQLEGIIENNIDINEDKIKMLKRKIQDLELELVSKHGKIATLELQIQSENFPYQVKCKDLEENLLAFSNKNAQLEGEIRRLKKAMNDISIRECDVCRYWNINRRDQYTQTVPDNTIRFCGTSSGIIDEHVKIQKLEREKSLMKDLCRSRCRRIKELEEQVKQLQSTKYLSVLHSNEISKDNVSQASLFYSNTN